MGKVTRFFRKVEVDKYAEYGEPDGLVRKVNLYWDFRKTLLREVRYFFQNRTDNLFFRRKLPLSFTTVDYYRKNYGLMSGESEQQKIKWPHWKKIRIEEGVRRLIEYYPLRFDDGLVEIDEVIGEKMILRYSGRDDRLEYCSVRYEPYRGTISQSSSQSGGEGKDDRYLENIYFGKVKILKMVQKYGRDPEADPHEQIRKLIIDNSRNQIKLDYHLRPQEIAPRIKKFFRDEIASLGDPGSSHRLDTQESQREAILQLVNAMSKKCEALLRQAERLCTAEVREFRRRVDARVYRLRRGFDTTPILRERRASRQTQKVKGQRSSQGNWDEEFDEDDLVEPVLRRLGYQTPLTPNSAREVRLLILEDLKRRNDERIAIVRTRFEEEKKRIADLSRKARHRLANDTETGGAQESQIAHLTFKVSILEQRMTNLHRSSLAAFQEIERKLDMDHRLKPALNS